MDYQHYKLAVHVPTSHTDEIRKAIGDAGGGQIGEYSHCAFTVRGQGSYMGSEEATPYNGSIGNLEYPVEDRIEATVSKQKIKSVINSIRKAHPYEEPTIDIYPLISESDIL